MKLLDYLIEHEVGTGPGGWGPKDLPGDWANVLMVHAIKVEQIRPQPHSVAFCLGFTAGYQWAQQEAPESNPAPTPPTESTST